MSTNLHVQFYVDQDFRIRVRVEGYLRRGGKYRKEFVVEQNKPILTESFVEFLNDCSYEARNAAPTKQEWGAPMSDFTMRQSVREPKSENITLVTKADLDAKEQAEREATGRGTGLVAGYPLVDMANTPFGRSQFYNPKTDYQRDMGARAMADGYNNAAEVDLKSYLEKEVRERVVDPVNLQMSEDWLKRNFPEIEIPSNTELNPLDHENLK